jgi:hypothetical protein
MDALICKKSTKDWRCLFRYSNTGQIYGALPYILKSNLKYYIEKCHPLPNIEESSYIVP